MIAFCRCPRRKTRSGPSVRAQLHAGVHSDLSEVSWKDRSTQARNSIRPAINQQFSDSERGASSRGNSATILRFAGELEKMHPTSCRFGCKKLLRRWGGDCFSSRFWIHPCFPFVCDGRAGNPAFVRESEADAVLRGDGCYRFDCRVHLAVFAGEKGREAFFHRHAAEKRKRLETGGPEWILSILFLPFCRRRCHSRHSFWRREFFKYRCGLL